MFLRLLWDALRFVFLDWDKIPTGTLLLFLADRKATLFSARASNSSKRSASRQGRITCKISHVSLALNLTRYPFLCRWLIPATAHITNEVLPSAGGEDLVPILMHEIIMEELGVPPPLPCLQQLERLEPCPCCWIWNALLVGWCELVHLRRKKKQKATCFSFLFFFFFPFRNHTREQVEKSSKKLLVCRWSIRYARFRGMNGHRESKPLCPLSRVSGSSRLHRTLARFRWLGRNCNSTLLEI